jgi:xanthine dehydrogenase/oxidase
MAPFTVAAKHANAFLKGKKFAELETLEGTMNALEQDFNLSFGVPGGMASYRKSLALGFFYRFYHEAMLALGKKEADEQAVDEIERELSTGQEDHEAAVAYAQEVVGKSNNHLAALKQVTGEAQYTDDIPVQKNELYGCLVLSTKAHAKILSVDYTPALDIPGVVGYVDKNDMPNAAANRWGAPHFEETFFAEDEIFTAGQAIALILATSAVKATEGARAVKVEYEELPAVFSIEEAIEKESFYKYFREIKKGDVEDAFAKSDYVFSGVARMGGQEHFYLETNACVAIPKPEDGEIEIWSSTQNPNEAYVPISSRA